MDGHHHLSLRERIYKRFEPYPHPDALKRLLDQVMVFVALVGPLATLPQVYQVYMTQDTHGLSIITWSVWVLLSFVWLLYGFVHKQAPIMISNSIYIVLESAIVIAILIYN